MVLRRATSPVRLHLPHTIHYFQKQGIQVLSETVKGEIKMAGRECDCKTEKQCAGEDKIQCRGGEK